jgi:hypothetical protein
MLLVSAWVSFSMPALAQTDEELAWARSAAEAGFEAFSEERWAETIDLFTRAESLVHSNVHRLFIARSHVQLGQLVRAREQYIKIVNERLAPNAPDPVREAHDEAEQELRALEPRIPYVTVTPDGAGGQPVTITMDDAPFPPALVGVPRPVDPGERRFRAYAEGLASPEVTLNMTEGMRERLTLALEPSTDRPPHYVPPEDEEELETPGVVVAPTATPEDSGPTRSGGSGLRTAGWVSLGVGAVGLGVGTVFGLQALSKRSDANDLADTCTAASPCSPATADQIGNLDDQANGANTLAIVGFAVGGVGVAAGITLQLLGGGDSDSANEPGITPWVGLGSAGMSGRF